MLISIVAVSQIASAFVCPTLIIAGRHLRLPSHIIGITLMALGNSANDIAASAAGVASGHGRALALGDPLGAAVFIGTVVLGAVVLVAPPRHRLARRPLLRDAVMALTSAATLAYIGADRHVSLKEIMLLAGVYVVYVVITVASRSIRIACPGLFWHPPPIPWLFTRRADDGHDHATVGVITGCALDALVDEDDLAYSPTVHLPLNPPAPAPPAPEMASGAFAAALIPTIEVAPPPRGSRGGSVVGGAATTSSFTSMVSSLDDSSAAAAEVTLSGTALQSASRSSTPSMPTTATTAAAVAGPAGSFGASSVGGAGPALVAGLGVARSSRHGLAGSGGAKRSASCGLNCGACGGVGIRVFGDSDTLAPTAGGAGAAAGAAGGASTSPLTPGAQGSRSGSGMRASGGLGSGSGLWALPTDTSPDAAAIGLYGGGPDSLAAYGSLFETTNPTWRVGGGSGVAAGAATPGASSGAGLSASEVATGTDTVIPSTSTGSGRGSATIVAVPPAGGRGGGVPPESSLQSISLVASDSEAGPPPLVAAVSSGSTLFTSASGVSPAGGRGGGAALAPPAIGSVTPKKKKKGKAKAKGKKDGTIGAAAAATAAVGAADVAGAPGAAAVSGGSAPTLGPGALTLPPGPRTPPAARLMPSSVAAAHGLRVLDVPSGCLCDDDADDADPLVDGPLGISGVPSAASGRGGGAGRRLLSMGGSGSALSSWGSMGGGSAGSSGGGRRAARRASVGAVSGATGLVAATATATTSRGTSLGRSGSSLLMDVPASGHTAASQLRVTATPPPGADGSAPPGVRRSSGRPRAPTGTPTTLGAAAGGLRLGLGSGSGVFSTTGGSSGGSSRTTREGRERETASERENLLTPSRGGGASYGTAPADCPPMPPVESAVAPSGAASGGASQLGREANKGTDRLGVAATTLGLAPPPSTLRSSSARGGAAGGAVLGGVTAPLRRLRGWSANPSASAAVAGGAARSVSNAPPRETRFLTADGIAQPGSATERGAPRSVSSRNFMRLRTGSSTGGTSLFHVPQGLSHLTAHHATSSRSPYMIMSHSSQAAAAAAHAHAHVAAAHHLAASRTLPYHPPLSQAAVMRPTYGSSTPSGTLADTQRSGSVWRRDGGAVPTIAVSGALAGDTELAATDPTVVIACGTGTAKDVLIAPGAVDAAAGGAPPAWDAATTAASLAACVRSDTYGGAAMSVDGSGSPMRYAYPAPQPVCTRCTTTAPSTAQSVCEDHVDDIAIYDHDAAYVNVGRGWWGGDKGSAAATSPRGRAGGAARSGDFDGESFFTEGSLTNAHVYGDDVVLRGGGMETRPLLAGDKGRAGARSGLDDESDHEPCGGGCNAAGSEYADDCDPMLPPGLLAETLSSPALPLSVRTAVEVMWVDIQAPSWTLWAQIASVPAIPVIIFLHMSIPPPSTCVTRWRRGGRALLLAFPIATTFVIERILSLGLIGTAVALAIASVISILIALSPKDSVPRWYSMLMPTVSFTICLMWIWLLSSSAIAVLEAVGVAANISQALLAVTLLSLGNAMNDLVTDTSVARGGRVSMALSAIFAGPTVSLTVGLATALLGAVLTAPDQRYSIALCVDHFYSIIIIFAGVITSIFMIVVVGRWSLPRSLAVALFCLYGVYVIGLLSHAGGSHILVDYMPLKGWWSMDPADGCSGPGRVVH